MHLCYKGICSSSLLAESFFTEDLTPHLTTCWQDTRTLGALSAEHLIRAIEEPKTTIPEQIMVSGKILEGASVKDLTEQNN